MSNFQLTTDQERVYRAYRAVDCILERALRAEPNDDEVVRDGFPTVRSILIDLQITNCQRCENNLIELGVNPNEPEDGLCNWLAGAFAEHADFYINLKESLPA